LTYLKAFAAVANAYTDYFTCEHRLDTLQFHVHTGSKQFRNDCINFNNQYFCA